MRKRKQVVAMLLAASMSISLLSTEALAARGNSKQSVTDEVMQQEVADSQSHTQQTESDGQIVDEWETFQIPDIIEKEEVDEKGYIGRDFESEKDLNTFVFKNSDGSNTMRIYDYPVKYVDNNGDIKDITTDIEKGTDGAYITKDNAIKTRFPKYFGQGIELTSDNVNIELVPKGMDNTSKYASTSIPVQAVDDKTVSYYYGTNTTLEYELTYTGFKEDIVVSEYTGQTEYDFTIYTNGLYLSEEDGSYYLVDDEGTVQATIGDIIIFTADEANNTMGSMTSVTIVDGQEYLLTIHVDAEYLKDEKTVYPIRIDPTIEVNYDNNGAGAIEDVTINSGSGSSGSSGSMYVGKRSTYGISRTLMKFLSLSLTSVYSESYITSATVEIRDLLCQTTAMTVQCYVFNGNSWSESTANWSNVSPSSYTTLLSSNSISYANGKNQTTAHRYKFDITAAVKGWKSGTYTQAKGIMFKATSSVENGSTYIYKTFASYNRASYKPSLSVTYAIKPSDVTLSMAGNYAMVGQEKTISVTKYPSDLAIMWQSTDRSVATVSDNVITGRAKGTTTIIATYRDVATGSYTTQKINVEIMDDLGIESGTVYNIRNYSSGNYMSLASSTDTSGTNVCVASSNDTSLSQWIIILQSDLKYQLVSQYSITSKVLNITGTNANIYTDYNQQFQMFDIARVESGEYDGCYLIRYGKYYVAEDTTGNVYITETLDGNCVWSITPVKRGWAPLYSMRIDNDIDTSVNDYIYYHSYMQAAGYKTIEDTCNQFASSAYTHLQISDIFLFNGHGDPGMIIFHNNKKECQGQIVASASVSSSDNLVAGGTIESIEELDDNALAGLRCVLYLACYTGVDANTEAGTYNLMKATYEKGAHFVLATNTTIQPINSNPFLENFMLFVSEGETIQSAIDKAVDALGLNSQFGDQIIYIGDTSQVLAD